MPSIKKRVTGFIRQFSAPSGSNPDRSDKNSSRGGKKDLVPRCVSPQSPNATAPFLPECFIQKYLNG